MRCYALYNENGKLIAIGTGYGGTEITKEQYDALLAEIREKTELVNKLYNGEITIEEVPTEWREEIQRRVNERIERDALNAEMYDEAIDVQNAPYSYEETTEPIEVIEEETK